MKITDVKPGDKFGKLKVLKISDNKGFKGASMHDCVCDCGKHTSLKSQSLITGHTKSCGRCNELYEGQRFGKLLVVKKSENKGEQGASMFDCLCDCGKTTTVWASRLKSGNTKSCGNCNAISEGDRFGKLEVIKESEIPGFRGQSRYECLCDCGKSSVVAAKSLKCGGTKSCGHCRDIYPGDKFGKLLVVKESNSKGPKGSSLYDCKCDCGNSTTTHASRLKNGTTKSCGHCNDISVGDRFNRLTVVRKSDGKSPQLKCDCLCDCGNFTSVLASHLKNKHTKSCGHCPTIYPEQVFGKLKVVKKSDKKGNQGQSMYDCVCECGGSSVVAANSLRSGNTKSCGSCIDSFISVGGIYGKLRAIKKSDNRGPRGESMYDCVCECGTEISVFTHKLKSGGVKSCGCTWKHRDRDFALMNNKYNNRIVYASKKLSLDYDITLDDFCVMIKQPCFYCGSSGVNVYKDYDRTRGVRKISDAKLVWNGIDRVDSNIGYMRDNVVTSCIHCNRAKSDMTQDDFRRWAKSAYIYHEKIRKGHQRKTVSVKPLDMNQQTFNGGYKRDAFETAIVKDLFWSKIVIRCQRRKTIFDITLSDFNTIIRQPCHYCGIENSAHAKDKIIAKTGQRRSEVVVPHNGIDRINSSHGYVKSNIVASCWKCNRAKNNRNQSEFNAWLKQLYYKFVVEQDSTDGSENEETRKEI